MDTNKALYFHLKYSFGSNFSNANRKTGVCADILLIVRQLDVFVLWMIVHC
jgi:hypothetical protein